MFSRRDLPLIEDDAWALFPYESAGGPFLARYGDCEDNYVLMRTAIAMFDGELMLYRGETYAMTCAGMVLTIDLVYN